MTRNRADKLMMSGGDSLAAARRALAEDNRRPGARRGVALLMVLIIVSVLTIVSLAAIATATLTTQAGENFAAHAAALQAAQSGVEVAGRRLSHPWDVGLAWGDLWPGTEGFVAMPATSDGRGGRCDVYYKVSVTQDDEYFYVTSTGLAVAVGGSPGRDSDIKARSKVTATLQRPKLEIPYAAYSNSLMLLPSKVTVSGNVHSNGDLWLWFGGRIDGNASSVGMIVNFGSITGTRSNRAGQVSIPAVKMEHYWPTYSYEGLSGTPTRVYNSINGDLPGALPGNPDNIYYSDSSSITLNKAKLQGTLLARGEVRMSGQVEIEARPGMPAMIIEGDLILSNNCKLTTHGLVVIRGIVCGTGKNKASSAQWTHNGPLVFEQFGGFASNMNGHINLNYRLDRTAVKPVSQMIVPVPMVSYSETD